MRDESVKLNLMWFGLYRRAAFYLPVPSFHEKFEVLQGKKRLVLFNKMVRWFELSRNDSLVIVAEEIIFCGVTIIIIIINYRY